MVFGFRSDGDRVKDVSPTRRIMPFIMPRRNESMVFFDLEIDAAPVNAFLEQARGELGKKVTFLHVLIAAAARILDERPRLNRFVAGGRLYQRRGIFVSFSAKREKSDTGQLVALKRQLEPRWPLLKIIEHTDVVVSAARSSRRDQTDKELDILLALPTFMLALFVRLATKLDAWGLLPHSMMAGDPLFSSVFIANLGSVGMDAPQHHLYEWGNIPLFCAIGAERDAFCKLPDGTVGTKRVIPLRFTFDERIEDGLYCLGALQRLSEMLHAPQQHFALREGAASG